MSVKTQIDRIKQSKANIISSLIAKGVNVPTDASIDDLPALIDSIQNGGSGGGTLETCTITVDFDGPPGFLFFCYYINGRGGYETVELPGVINNVQKNTLMIVYGCPAMYIGSESITRLEHDMGTSVFFVTGNGSITFQG